ncbi:uncharacterized protein LOC101861562 [Aplysia californica]|uniref:Uncharacterized protein LOC101861562 n=1 Tax=Aplysia californica TaxID=6500 RepID=A0ABM0JGS1_APLCA|nr:uncharacterized protein LOC101861562 [Aplysia californica]
MASIATSVKRNKHGLTRAAFGAWPSLDSLSLQAKHTDYRIMSDEESPVPSGESPQAEEQSPAEELPKADEVAPEDEVTPEQEPAHDVVLEAYLEPTAPPAEQDEIFKSPPTEFRHLGNFPLPQEPLSSVVFSPSPDFIPRRAPPETVVETQLPTIFGRVPERCVTFCIDTSGSMFNCLHVVKDQLMETLSSLAARDDQPMFNLIEFNSQVTQWADKMVQCTPETVAVAEKWISNLAAKTGTNTQDALLTALADPGCQAVYLVSDGLPDQYADDVLDRVVGVCGRRCIHCIYLTGETADEVATEFMEDLAVETFGSFHIVTLTTHGCVERITPVYRSDHSHEKLVHTVNNTLRPNIKTCSVSTTLQVDPDKILGGPSRAAALAYAHNPFVIPPALYSTLPHRYYYPYYWSRYRPAKAWLAAQDKLGDPVLDLSPAAGSLLVGKKVVARRIEDGYFYRATVQSQNFGEKFLLAFGPCKHGKYRQTEYQDTYVFDIVDYVDALRHTIISGDRVLAPWEPEGERFAPGIVLEGQEKRHADGPADQPLTVSFSNGRTEKVPGDVAVWIHPSTYERLSLELQMPTEARKSLLSTADQYPIENLPGYPTSGPSAEPREYPRVDPFVVENSSYLWDPYMYRYPPYLPYGYPPFVVSPRRRVREDRNRLVESKAVDDAAAVIPGTDMTRQELDDRVMSQLMEHRLTSVGDARKERVTTDRVSVATDRATAEYNAERAAAASRLLSRRGKQEENVLKKSVTFIEQEDVHNIPNRADAEELVNDEEFDEYGNPAKFTDSGVNTDSSLLFYTSPGIKGRPRWNYWRNDPSPSYSEISGGIAGDVAPKEPGPFRETALQAPLEARDQRESPYNVEWTSPAFKYVDTYAKHDYSNSVEECLGTPKPPSQPDTKAFKRNYTVASRPIASMTPEEREETRRANRRRRVIKREAEWQARLVDEDNMKSLMQDQHRERILGQMERDRQRQIKEQQDIQLAREAKKKISHELRIRIEQNQKDEADRENRRIEALRRRREKREQIQAQRDQDIAETVQRREDIRKQNNESRLQSWTEKLNEQDAKEAALDKQHRDAKINRLRHYRTLEKEGQDRKDLRLVVKEQNQVIYRSQIFA